EPVGLRAPGGHQPREEAVRRQAGAARAVAGARSVPGLAGLVEDRDREGGRRGAGAGHAGRGAIRRAPAHSKRLLKGAGPPDGFSFTFKNRGIPIPYEPVGVWLIDQWRQVGLNVKQEVVEAAAYYGQVLRPGNFEVAMDFQCGYI